MRLFGICGEIDEIDYLLNVASNSWHFQWSSFICLRNVSDLLLSPIEHEATAFFGLDCIPKTTFLSLFDVQASVLKTQHVPSLSI